MYLVCRDVKRVESEVMTMRSRVEALMSHVMSGHNPHVLPPQAFPGLPPQHSQALPQLSHPQQVLSSSSADELACIDNISEDLRTMLVRIEEQDIQESGDTPPPSAVVTCMAGMCAVVPPELLRAIPPDLLRIPDEVVAVLGEQQALNSSSVIIQEEEDVIDKEGKDDEEVAVPEPLQEPTTKANEDSSSFTESTLRAMRIDELRKLLRDRSMDITGKKDVLVARLMSVQA